MTQLNVTELDFSKIKQSIKDYISDQDEFRDYNFQGSVINLLIDTLAYNTYQNAFYTSMVGNEMFLDSAQLRDSVVSRAKMLGYIPSTVMSAKTNVNITYNDISNSDVITLPKGEAFNVVSDTGETLQFITNKEYNVYSALGYTSDIEIFEGYSVDQKFTVNTSSPVRYILQNANIDSSSINVIVRDSVGSDNITTFALANDILEVSADTSAFFVQEIQNQTLEIYFGDGNIGTKLQNGNIVEINYRVSVGKSANEIKTTAAWSAKDANIEINNISDDTYGGNDVENISSIKFNAPKNYETQNRAVLAEDYKRIAAKYFPGLIGSIRVWGGEQNIPPVYGKVFMSVNPAGSSNVLSSTQKDTLRKNLKKYNILTNEIEFVDPSYNYILPSITAYYNSNITSLTSTQIAEKIATAVQQFETDFLGSFDNNHFRFSKFSSIIDAADASITYNSTNIILQKRFAPSVSNITKYTINFDKELDNNVNESTCSSTAFTLNEKTSYLDDDGAGNIRSFYYNSTNDKIYTNNTQGTIDYDTGVLILNNFAPTVITNNELIIDVIPKDYNFITNKYLLMLLSNTTITVKDELEQQLKATITVNTTGSVTQIDEINVGTII
jgi:hypothetical protein